jgi:tRNA-specific 2-thiouridylase
MVSKYARSPERTGEGVAVGMSGGIDSCIAAWILKQRGFRVVGVTLRFVRYSRFDEPARACCDKAAIEQAENLCAGLGIPHYTVHVEDEFSKKVLEYFVREYMAGRTPNPCIVCNERVKLPALAKCADRLGLEHTATGHYARLVRGPGGRTFLARARDPGKDQSYVLYRVPVKLLERCIFPVGEMKKSEVGALASRLGVRPGNGGESQDACFIPSGGLGGFLEEHLGFHEGDFVDSNGGSIGRHRGIHFYTVGQRRGLGVSAATPLYVKQIDATDNTIVLAPDGELHASTAVCRRLKLRTHSLEGPLRAMIRYRHKAARVKTVRRSSGSLEVEFAHPQRAITPGQSLVLYREGLVVGGGVIEEAVPEGE